MGTVPQSATYSDVLNAPEHLVAEILSGALYTHPRPAPRHARSTSSLVGSMYDPFDRGRGGPGGWIILIEPELHLGRDVIVPDVAGWRRERMPKLPETEWFELAPDWVCAAPRTASAALAWAAQPVRAACPCNDAAIGLCRGKCRCGRRLCDDPQFEC